MDDVYILREIAGSDKELWKLFSMLNKDMNKYFSVKNIEYELKFRRRWNNGKFIYYQLDGEYHRSDGPARIWNGGDEDWYFNGEYHRSDGPAVIYSDGSQCWYFNGELHRLDEPAVITLGFSGSSEWWVDGKRHRLDGPAVIKNSYRSYRVIWSNETEADEARGDREWWVDGKRHRLDGPAVEFLKMPHRNEWWINGRRRKDKENIKERIRMDKILDDKRIRDIQLMEIYNKKLNKRKYNPKNR